MQVAGKKITLKASHFQVLNKGHIALFFFIWLCLGITMDRRDLNGFTLQQAGIDAIVTHGTFTLGHSELKILKPRGDTFRGKRGIMPAKQPGQFATGAIAYFFISHLGMTYERDYLLTAALVSWFSAALIGSIALTMLYLVLVKWGIRKRYAVWSSLSVALGSNWLIFGGVPHHDILSISYLVMGLYFAERAMDHLDGEKWYFSILAGFFAGISVFTSMLPALIVMAFGFYVFFTLRLKHILYVGLGFFLGLLPLAIYNGYYFDNPLTQANMAGNFSDTFINFIWKQFIDRVDAYVGWGGISIWKYSPLVALGFFGVLMLPKSYRRIKFFVVTAVALHLFYLFNIETKGTCMYGPRYLIPLLPLLGLGVPVLLDRTAKWPQFFVGIVFGALLGYSLWVSVVGSVGSAFQCDLRNFTFGKYLVDSQKVRMENLPFFYHFSVCFVLLGAASVALNWQKIKPYIGYFSRSKIGQNADLKTEEG